MKKITFIFLLFGLISNAQLSPGLSATLLETSVTAGSNKGVTSDALFNYITPSANIHQLRGSYGSGGESIEALTTDGIYLLSSSSTGTKPNFVARVFEVKKSQTSATFISQTAYHTSSGKTATRTSADSGATWSAWLEYAAIDSPVFTTSITAPLINGSGLTASRAVVTDASKNLISSATTSTQIGYLSTTTSDVQTQISAKADLTSPTFTGDPKAPTATAVDNDTSIATTAFVTGAITTAKPYKVYTALISQTGTSAPTVIVLENTLGGTPVWSRIGTGVYSGLLSGFFTANKTTVIFTKQYTVPTGGTDIFTAAGCGSINSIDLSTANTAGLVDGVLSKATIEVRVYN